MKIEFEFDGPVEHEADIWVDGRRDGLAKGSPRVLREIARRVNGWEELAQALGEAGPAYRFCRTGAYSYSLDASQLARLDTILDRIREARS